MFRLTLRSRKDGRFLARIIERDGFAFVLDYGDPDTVADASERVARGFTVFHEGAMKNVLPASKELLPRLADYYDNEGLLVKLEEQHVQSMAPQPSPYAATHSPLADALPGASSNDPDDETELVPIGEVPMGEQVTLIRKRSDIEEETVRLDVPVLQRKMWAPEGDDDPDGLSLSEHLVPVPTSERTIERSFTGDEEETELVPLEMRQKVISGEDHTQAHTDGESMKGRLDSDEGS